MPRHPTSSRKYEIEHLWDKHFEIARLAVLGYSPKEISPIVSMTKEHISTVMNSEVFKEHLTILRSTRDAETGNISARILEMAPVALKRLKEVVEEPMFFEDEKLGKVPNPYVRPELTVKVSQDLLDRAGFGAVEKRETTHYDVSKLEKLKKAALDAGIKDGSIVMEDANFEDIQSDTGGQEANKINEVDSDSIESDRDKTTEALIRVSENA
jgi:hypothetical protein